MPAETLLLVRTGHRRYACRYSDLHEIRAVAHTDDLLQSQTTLPVELGVLLDPADHSAQMRRHALLVPLRRRMIALLVDTVETFIEAADLLPLPPLIMRHLQQPWAIGVIIDTTAPVVVLDARAIARSILHSRRIEALPEEGV
ncbi:MAG TPA: hypothetical protein PKA05_06335 [Roseiflexaceae bacterium]|nr:hypothetical protein [Roseiflexaceae bacterium]